MQQLRVYRRLYRIAADRTGGAQRAFDQSKSLGYQCLVPQSAILVLEQNDVALGSSTRRMTRSMQQHQRRESQHRCETRMGRTSIDPLRAPGMRAAMVMASSSVLASIR